MGHAKHKHGGAVEKLKSVVRKCAIASTPAKSLSLQHSTLIDKRIQELVPTPHHPPYAWMIENAIKEEGVWDWDWDWDAEAISKFILEQHYYKDLHWAHAALLPHHFKKLAHHNLTTITSSTPVSTSTTPTYDESSHSSASSQSFTPRQKKKKKKKKKKIFRKKKRMNARGMSNWDGEMTKQVFNGQVCLDGMVEVDIQSLLTEDETDIQVPNQQQQQIIEAIEHEYGTNNGSSTPTAFPSSHQKKTKRIRNSRSKHRKPHVGTRRGRPRKIRESESSMMNAVEANTNYMMEEESQVHVNGVEQDSMDELIEQVYGELTETPCTLTIDGEADVPIHQAYDDINEQQRESRKLAEKRKHLKQYQSGSGICIEEQSQCRPKLRPRPYRKVADIYESSDAHWRSNCKSSRPS